MAHRCVRCAAKIQVAIGPTADKRALTNLD
jgi:hypothetical protein